MSMFKGDSDLCIVFSAAVSWGAFLFVSIGIINGDFGGHALPVWFALALSAFLSTIAIASIVAIDKKLMEETDED